VGEKIPHREFAGGVGVVEAEPGEVIDDPVIPLQAAFVHELGQQGRGEGLGVGGDLEPGPFRDGGRIPQLLHAVALGQHDAAILHHGHGGPRRFEGLQGLEDVGIQILRQGAGRRGGGHESRGRQRQADGQAGADGHEDLPGNP